MTRTLERFLTDLAHRTGAGYAVVASSDGLLVAGVGRPADDLETLAAHAPSQLPCQVVRPAGLETRRLEVDGLRLYLGLDVAPPADAAADLTRLLGS